MQFLRVGDRKSPVIRLMVVGLAVALGVGIALLPIPVIGAGLALGVVAIGLGCVVREPALGVGLTMVLAPFAPLEKELLQLPVDSGQIMLAVTLACYMGRSLLRRDPVELARVRYDKGTLGLLCLFVATSLISFFPAADFNAWFRECLKWVEVTVLYLVVANSDGLRQRRIIIGGVILSAVVQGGLGLYQFVFRGGAPDHFAISGRFFRAFGTFQQPNPFGGFMGMVWPVAAALAVTAFIGQWPGTKRHAGRLPGVALGICALLVGAAMVASWSRGAWLAAAVAIAGMAIVVSRRPGRALVLLGALAIAVVSLNAVALLPASVSDRLIGFTSQFTGGDTDVRYLDLNGGSFATIERLAHWQAAEGMITDHPWFGVGFGNYEIAYPLYRTLYWVNGLGHAHNYYLNIWAETGVVGLAAYCAFWFYVIARTVRVAVGNGARRIRDTNWIVLGILGAWLHLAAHNIVDNLYVANLFLVVGVFLGLVESSALVKFNDNEQHNNGNRIS